MSRRALDRLAVILGIIAVLVSAGYVAYELAERPTNQEFGMTITSGPAAQHVVALTFDDGPNPPYTDRILNLLKQEHVHATFFVVGRAAAAYPNILRREIHDGHALGNHTWDHRHLILESPDEIKRSLQRTDDAIYAATGKRTRFMRPPFGARDWSVMRVAKSLGYTVVMWNVPMAREWQHPPARVVALRILSVAKEGAIIVLHDGNRGIVCARANVTPNTCDRGNVVQAIGTIVRALKTRGYRFVTIPELVAIDEATRKNGLAAR